MSFVEIRSRILVVYKFSVWLTVANY